MTAEPKRVADIMRTELVTTSPETTLEEFLELAEREGISGAPVVDEAGRAVGVVSLTDVVRALRPDAARELVTEPGAGAPKGEGAGESGDGRARRRLGDRPGVLSGGSEEARTVGDAMTSSVFSVRPEARLADAASFLADAEIHRALVLRNDRPIGLVTTFDLLRAMAAEAEG